MNRPRRVDGIVEYSPISFNDWGFRDYKRSISKEAGRYRILMIGDSYLEGPFCRFPLSVLVENDLLQQKITHIENINLGVSDTRPIEYFFRLRDFGRTLSADAVFLFFYVGNDFSPASETYSTRAESPFTRLIARRPIPSILGTVAPRLNDLFVKGFNDLSVQNRISLEIDQSGLQLQGVGTKSEFSLLNEYLRLPYDQGMEKMVRYVHKVYFPDEDQETIRQILAKNDKTFWSVVTARDEDQEYMQGWVLKNLVKGELEGSYLASEEEAVATIDEGEIEAAFSWLKAAKEFCREMKIPMRVFIIPVGAVDPEFRRFWSPWPVSFSYHHVCNAMHSRLVQRLQSSDVKFIDLRPVLQDIPGTYQKLSNHWTEKGHRVVADSVKSVVLQLGNK